MIYDFSTTVAHFPPYKVKFDLATTVEHWTPFSDMGIDILVEKLERCIESGKCFEIRDCRGTLVYQYDDDDNLPTGDI